MKVWFSTPLSSNSNAHGEVVKVIGVTDAKVARVQGHEGFDARG